MSGPLVETKLRLPPRRSDLVARPGPTALLERAMNAPVTLVSAPAGFGKTSLLTAWTADVLAVRGDAHQVAWVSLDEGDRRAETFWTYVLTSLDRALPGSGAAALTLLESGQAPLEVVLTAVVNELSVHPGDLTVVLDDYHRADGVDVATGMTFLVEHLPPQLRLVIGTRADPGLPLSRLRAGGDLVEIRAADLRFTEDEVARYLRDVHGLRLSAGDLAALSSRTEGWVAALQLAALSLRGRDDASAFIAGFAGDDRYVLDYLADEVLAAQPDDVRRFLLDTSVLERLSGSLCAAVSPSHEDGHARVHGQAMLEHLERANLFVVALDDRRTWFRYHHLFGDVLRAHLLHERPDEVPELHARASRWYEQDGQTEEAVRHALAAGRADTAADLAERALPRLGRERREHVVRGWAEVFPDEVVASRPVLAMGLIGGLMSSNQFAEVAERLRDVERRLAEPDPHRVVLDGPALARLPAAAEMYHAALALIGGEPTVAVERAQRAIATSAGDDLIVGAAAALSALASWTQGDLLSAHAGYAVSIEALTRAGHIADVLGCSIAKADLELGLGRLRAAEHTVQHALDLTRASTPSGPGVVRGTADMLVASSRVAWHRDDLSTVADLLRRSDELGEGAALAQNPYRWRVQMARLRAAEGDLPVALDLLEEAERVYVGDYSPDVQPVHATRARVLTARGDLAAARAWAREHGVEHDDDLSYLREYEHVTLAGILLAEHTATGATAALSRARVLLDRLLAAAQAGQRVGTVLELEVLRSVALIADGDRPRALGALAHAVEIARADGWRRVLVDRGPVVAGLLHELGTAPRDGRATAGHPPPGAGAGRTPGVPDRLVDPLSDREVEVLRLLASDLDGPAIARHLVVSLNTVRTHTQHIYTKLGVNNRRSAVSRGHQLGLLTQAVRP